MIDRVRFPALAAVLAKKPIKKAGKLEFITYTESDPIDDQTISLIPETDALREYINEEYVVEHKIVAFRDGKPLGLATVEPLAAQHGEITAERNPNTDVIQLFVAKKARGLGIGEKLLRRALELSGADIHAGYVHHSEAFLHLAKKYGIRNLDDVQERYENDEGWKKDGTYEESHDD